MLRVLIHLAHGLLIAALLAGPGIVSTANAQEVSPSPHAYPDVIVTQGGDNSTLCGPHEAATLVAGFIDAFNQGDRERLLSFFWHDFKWFGVGAKDEWTDVSDFFAYDPDSGFASAGPDALEGSAAITLPPYFAERFRHGDTWRLDDVMVIPEAGGEISGLLFHVAREADDLPPSDGDQGHRYIGKGQVNCATGTIILWVMNPARPGTADDQPACPLPATEAVPPAIIACGPPS